jgi:4-hydroxymandelate oxidase
VNPEEARSEDTRLSELSRHPPRDELAGVFNLAAFEPLAQRALPRGAFDYYRGGAGDENTLRESVSAFSKWRLRPRVLVDVSSIDMSSEMLGIPVAMPVGFAPTALAGLAHPDGELITARAAATAGVTFCLSTLSSRTIEEVATVSGKPSWFQLYVHKDRAVAKSLVERAEAAGYDALVVTVDLPVVGYREADLRNRFEVAPELYGNLIVPEAAGREFHEVVNFVSDPALTWGDLAWVRSLTSLPVVVKGILTAEDAALAIEHGVDGIVVSNHGGRQLDGAVTALDALEEVVTTVGDSAEVYVDGGVRRGTDFVIALALGARGVFIGRPFLFALAAGGQRGVERALSLIGAETENAMALLGVRNLQEITRAHVTRA